MAALFSRRWTLAFRGLLVLGAAALVATPVALMIFVRSPTVTGQNHHPAQPMWFPHELHAGRLGIDCRYCHSSVEHSATAGMPSTRKCVYCHNDVWLQSATFAPVRASLASGKPIPWQRVNSLPDFVFFNHSIHVKKGVACETCHGRVDRMTTVSQAEPLTMQWCLGCHTHPAPFLRPLDEVTAMGWRSDDPNLGEILMRRYHVRSLTDCTDCHR